jgi:hypothetical protein
MRLVQDSYDILTVKLTVFSCFIGNNYFLGVKLVNYIILK